MFILCSDRYPGEGFTGLIEESERERGGEGSRGRNFFGDQDDGNSRRNQDGQDAKEEGRVDDRS